MHTHKICELKHFFLLLAGAQSTYLGGCIEFCTDCWCVDDPKSILCRENGKPIDDTNIAFVLTK